MDYNSKEWFDSLAKYREWNERAVWAAFALLGRPNSFLDLGCGDGWMVRAARMLGCKPAIGVEASVACRALSRRWAKVVEGDLGQPFTLRSKFDMVACVEVAEHLPADAARQLVDTIVRHATGWILWTAAPPGQNGEGHINCRPPEYWIELFEAYGLKQQSDLTVRLKGAWTYCTGPMFWLPQNVQVFHV